MFPRFPGLYVAAGVAVRHPESKRTFSPGRLPRWQRPAAPEHLFNTESTHGDIATMIHRQWLQQLGVDVDLEGVEVKVFGGRLHSHDFMISRAGW